MGAAEKNLLVDELKKHKLCRWFWSEQMEEELSKGITLSYEQTGEMGIYSRYFEFCQPYCGKEKELLGYRAVIQMGITANCPEYDIEKAAVGADCYHNVKVRVMKQDTIMLTSRFRLWSGQEDEYCGDEKLLSFVLGEKSGEK